MMREVIDHQYSSDFAPHIHSTLHAAKCCERFSDVLGGNAATLRNNKCRHGGQGVVSSRGGCCKIPQMLAPPGHAEPHSFAHKSKSDCHPSNSRLRPLGFHPAKSPARP